MGKHITVAEGHTEGIKTDHRNGQKRTIQNDVEVRPVIDGFHNETLRDKYTFGRDFVTIFQEDLYNLCKYGKMSLLEWRVLLYLCATLDKANITFTNLDVISDELSMDRAQVSRTITKLKKRNLIVERKLTHKRGDGPVPKIYCLPIAQLNWNFVYNGQVKDYKRVRTDHPLIATSDGVKLVNPEAEKERQKLLREQAARETLFPEYFLEEANLVESE